VKAGKTKALEMFNRGEGGFLDRDLYAFCYNIGDGKLVAVGNLMQSNYSVRTLGRLRTRPARCLA
jgi:hypothetical protein